MDLFRTSSTSGQADEQALARRRQQIVALMQRFPFVRQCIKCSAKNLLRVDDVFVKAQQSVIYPLTPALYDLTAGRLSVECQQALTRIFRMYDTDYDGLLSDTELDRFQRETYHVSAFDRDFTAWKKVVTRHNPQPDQEVIRDGKFTIFGFLAIFDVFISQNRLDVVWQALRKFGHDDDLNLHVPDRVRLPDGLPAHAWRLTSSAKKFLTNLFLQFDSDHDGVLSAEDVHAIFSILPPPALPPWHPQRATDVFQGAFSLPRHVPGLSPVSSSSSWVPSSQAAAVGTAAVATTPISLSSSGISVLSASDSLPSLDSSTGTSSLTYLEWMGWWHTTAAISPSAARAELFRLGHVERPSGGRRKKRGPASSATALDKVPVPPETRLKSREVRILVLGHRESGKTGLVHALASALGGATAVANAPHTVIEETVRPETSSTFIKIRRQTALKHSASKLSVTKVLDDELGEDLVVHLVFTDVPETAALSQGEHYRRLTELFGAPASPRDRICDLAMMVFDCTKAPTFAYLKRLESSLLTKETPRVFIGTMVDAVEEPEPEDGDASPSTLIETAQMHCRDLDLEPPLLLSTASLRRPEVLNHLARCVIREPGVPYLRSRPHEERQRREAARRRKMLWLGSIVTVGVVVAVGVGLLFGRSKKDKPRGGFGWLSSLFGSSSPREGAAPAPAPAPSPVVVSFSG
jgi:Ras family protein T1